MLWLEEKTAQTWSNIDDINVGEEEGTKSSKLLEKETTNQLWELSYYRR